MQEIRNNWAEGEIREIFNMPLLQLLYRAATVHRQHHHPGKVQVSALLSVKTGGCPEDCGYCPQSVHNGAKVKVHGILPLEEVRAAAEKAREAGASRICLGAAWRQVRDNRDFDAVLQMVEVINGMGMEVCCTLGMLSAEQAERLREAGLHAYNHNIDTSAEFYDKIISTRNYDERLETLHNVRKAGITVCAGGIIGMGESVEDRMEMLRTLANLDPHPESVPINALVPVEGTPLEKQRPPDIWEVLRVIATARILMPASLVRLSAGREQMSEEGQALCFLAGANSIFAGDKLLTTPNPSWDEDEKLLEKLGLEPMQPFEEVTSAAIEARHTTT